MPASVRRSRRSSARPRLPEIEWRTPAGLPFLRISLSLGGEGFLMQAGFTLVSVLTFQTVVMAAAMAWRMPAELRESLAAWRTCVWVGASGAFASVGWFTAMTLQHAALVRAVGQVELLFTLASSAIFFRERILPRELLGIGLVTAGILVLVLG